MTNIQPPAIVVPARTNQAIPVPVNLTISETRILVATNAELDNTPWVLQGCRKVLYWVCVDGITNGSWGLAFSYTNNFTYSTNDGNSLGPGFPVGQFNYNWTSYPSNHWEGLFTNYVWCIGYNLTNGNFGQSTNVVVNTNTTPPMTNQVFTLNITGTYNLQELVLVPNLGWAYQPLSNFVVTNVPWIWTAPDTNTYVFYLIKTNTAQ